MIEADMTTEDVAFALRLNRATVQRLLQSGRLKGYQIGRAWRIPTASVEEFRSQGQRSTERLPLFHGVPGTAASVTAGDEWERLLLIEDDLADVPPTPLEAMRRENLYEERC